MGAKQLGRLIAPHGVVQMYDLHHQLLRIGIPSARARRLCLSKSAAEALEYTRLDLFPDCALRKPRAIIDIGANAGFWTERALEVLGPVPVLAFEPDPHILPQVTQRLGVHPSVTLHSVALGEQAASAQLYSTGESSASSLLAPRVEEMVEAYGNGFEVHDRPEVHVAPLDDFTGDLEEVTIIKLDVQGYERQVLAGASATLARTRNVLVEATFYSHYEDDVTFHELHGALGAAGFVLWSMTSPYRYGNRAMWADALYTRN